MKLKDALPPEFLGGEFLGTKAYAMRDVEIDAAYGLSSTDDGKLPGWSWPGPHKNICMWVALVNGNAVGWNENPSRGWSFPVVRLKK